MPCILVLCFASTVQQMFGSEAAKLLNYVECFPSGFKKGTKMEKECADVGIEGFPTWVINGKVCQPEIAVEPFPLLPFFFFNFSKLWFCHRF